MKISQPLQDNSILNTNIKPNKIAIYIRVSSDKQKYNTSKATQLKVIKNYMANNNLDTIPYEVYDDTESASMTLKIDYNQNFSHDVDIIEDLTPSILLRDNLRRLMLDASLNKFDTLLAYSHDRLSRDVYEGLFIRHTLKKLGIKIVYCKPGEQILSGDESMDGFLENLLSNLAALEADIIGGRTFLGNEDNIRHNIWAGGPVPYGYNLVPHPRKPNKHTLQINFPEARLVIKLFELYNLGYSPKHIVDYFNKEYSSSRNTPWSLDAIKSILNNPVYTGSIVWNKKGGKRNPVRKPPDKYIKSPTIEKNIIINEEMWNRASYIKDLQKNNPKFLSTQFILKDLVICKVCGNPLRCKNHGNASGSVYMCNNKDTNFPPHNFNIKLNTLHEIVLSELSSLFKLTLNDDDSFNNLYLSYLNLNTKDKQDCMDRKKYLTDKLSENEELLIKVKAKIVELKNYKVVDSTDSENYKKNLVFLNSLSEFETHANLIKANLEGDIKLLTEKIQFYIPTKEEFKLFLNKNASILNTILSQKDTTLRNRCLRLLVTDLISNIKLDENRDIEINFK